MWGKKSDWNKTFEHSHRSLQLLMILMNLIIYLSDALWWRRVLVAVFRDCSFSQHFLSVCFARGKLYENKICLNFVRSLNAVWDAFSKESSGHTSRRNLEIFIKFNCHTLHLLGGLFVRNEFAQAFLTFVLFLVKLAYLEVIGNILLDDYQKFNKTCSWSWCFFIGEYLKMKLKGNWTDISMVKGHFPATPPPPPSLKLVDFFANCAINRCTFWNLPPLLSPLPPPLTSSPPALSSLLHPSPPLLSFPSPSPLRELKN